MGLLTSVTATVASTEYDLSDSIRAIHLGNDGFGLPSVQRLLEAGPNQDGSTDYGFDLQARTIQLALNMLATSNDATAYFTRREELMYIFAPRTDPIKLKVTTPLGTRQIDCFYTGGLGFPSQDKQAFFGHKVAINLVCPDPLWYNPVSDNYVFTLGISSSTMTIPLSIPWNVGASTLSQSTTIPYNGTYKTSPIVVVTGPVTNLVITNTSTGKKLDFTGNTIAALNTYTIDTRFDYQTITDQLNANQISKLTDDSDLDFQIEAAPIVSGGVNQISVSGTSVTSATSISLTYNTKYIGL